SPDGTRIVTGGSKPTVWDAKGTALVELNWLPKFGWVAGAWFSQDGIRLFTRSMEGTMKAWDTRTGKELPGEAIPSVDRNDRISPDGRLLAQVEHYRVKLVRLVPDEEEIAYRRLRMEPDPRRGRAG